ncbi:hypothetical protein MMC31_003308, partial [Peltigera leucophlebia]|nr:hypothetical protein [Peltigera leucophlebia]
TEAINTKFAIKHLSPHIPTQISDQVALAIRRDPIRNLWRTQKTVLETIWLSIDAIIEQDDTSWHEIDLVQVLQPAITNATNRILVEQDLYRNATFWSLFGDLAIISE